MVRKKKPIARCRFLFERPTQTGWDEVDPTQVPDYGDARWEPDDAFQAASGRLAAARPPPPTTPLPQRPIPPTHSARVQRRGIVRRGREGEGFCTMVLWVPPTLEHIARAECRKLWPECTSTWRCGKVLMTLKQQEDVVRAMEVRSAMELRVVVGEYKNFFGGMKTMDALFGKLRNEVKWMPWSGPLQTWAMLAENGGGYDPGVDADRWFPYPSFRVHCETANGERITNYDAVADAFTHGVQLTFRKWECNPNTPNIEIVLEIQEQDLTVVVVLKKCTVGSPYEAPYAPLNDPSVAHALLSMVQLAPGDVLLNCSCSELDVTSEALQRYPSLMHTVTCDIEPSAVAESVRQAGQWSEARDADGSICDSSYLPFRDNSVDVVVAMFHVRPTCRNPNKHLSRKLKEIARVVRTETGRVCILTEHEDMMESILNKRVNWTTVDKSTTVFGRFPCTLYILRRSHRPSPRAQDRHLVPPGLGNAMPHQRIRRNPNIHLPSTDAPPGLAPIANAPPVVHPPQPVDIYHPFQHHIPSPRHHPSIHTEEAEMDWDHDI